jgi:Holliday junction resolvase-like predicted endonuclease
MNLSDIKSRPHWSFSSLNQLLNICSLQYYLQRIAKIKPAFASTNLVLGSAYHRTLEQVYLAKMNGTVFSDEQALEFFTASWDRAVKTEPIRFRKLNAEETADQGRSLIACALEHLDPAEEVRSVSEAFVVPLQDAQGFLEMPLLGEFDLVVQQKKQTVLVDWKTSGTRWRASQADQSLQATGYSYAYHQKHAINPQVRFDVTVKNKTPVFEQHPTQRQPEQWQRMMKMIRRAEKLVRHEIFYPAESSFYCADCAFSTACKAWHRESRDQRSACPPQLQRRRKVRDQRSEKKQAA